MILLFLLAIVGAALASPGTEIALVLDNSCSMATESQLSGPGQKGRVPANDPERAAVLGALLVEGLTRGSADHLSVIGFGDGPTDAPRVRATADEIRALPYSNGTWFRAASAEAKSRLDASGKDGRLLIFFTDGAPSPGDVEDPSELPRLLGLDGEGGPDSFIIGLYGSEAASQLGRPFLAPLARRPEDLVLLDAGAPDAVAKVVAAFTRATATAMGSQPITGTLQPGGKVNIPVGRYVTELLVSTASARPGPPYVARLGGPAGDVPPQATGDNGCPSDMEPGNAPGLCSPPRRNYAVFRAPNNPDAASSWTLSLDSGASGPVEYGVILRYDLNATLALPPTARLGEPVAIEASLLFRGQVFADDAFFAADHFAVEVNLGDQTVALTHAGGGRFTGSWTPDTLPDGPLDGTVLFHNDWMQKRAHRPVTVEGSLPLSLVVGPVDLGRWRGERGDTTRCAEIDLSGSLNADRVPIRCEPGVLPEGLGLGCAPVPGSEAMLGSRAGQPLRWQVCATARGCCDDLPGQTPIAITLSRASDGSDAVVVPVTLAVEPTGWLRCWWLELAAVATTLFVGWIIAGIVRPHNFDPSATARVAGSLAALSRTSAMVLSEQPGGRRGFYRDARFSLDGDGGPVRKVARAVLVVEAGPGGSTRVRKAAGLERKNRRTGAFEAVEEASWAQGVEPGVVYRVGGLYLRFG